MICRDLGVVAAPVLVFGGPVGNRQALEALRAIATALGVPPERCICTGDVVAYCGDPAGSVALMRDWDVQCIQGNCEQALAADAAQCGCGFAGGSTCERLSTAWYAHARSALDQDARAWMASLPERLLLTLGGRRLAVVHGAPSAVNRFVFASTPEEVKRAELDLLGADGLLAGHCGLPFTQLIDGRLWHNAGSCGKPANDGTPRTWYGLLSPTADGLCIEHRALAYDHHAARADMQRVGLTQGYERCLTDGLWPSMDVLPSVERSQRGRPLAERRIHWGKKLLTE